MQENNDNQDFILAISKISKAMAGNFYPQELIKKIIVSIKNLFKSEKCLIVIGELETGMLEYVYGINLSKRELKEYEESFERRQGAKYGEGYLIMSLNELKNLNIDVKNAWIGKYAKNLQSYPYPFRNAIWMPLKIRNRTIGIIKVENKKINYGAEFGEEDFLKLKIIANIIAPAIENTRLLEKLRISTKPEVEKEDKPLDFSTENLEIYLQYTDLPVEELEHLFKSISGIHNALLSFSSPVYYNPEQDISYRNHLFIDNAFTGDSIKISFKEGWKFEFPTSKEGIEIKVPKNIGVPILIIYFVLKSATMAIESHNNLLDTRLKKLEIQVKEIELYQKINNSNDTKKTNMLKNKAKSFVRILNSSDFINRVEVNKIPIIDKKHS